MQQVLIMDFWRLICSLTAVFLFASAPAFCEAISDYRADIVLEPNGIAKVKEDFQIDFTGTPPRHHVYRNIPLRYTIGDAIHHVDVHLRTVSVGGISPPESSAWSADDVFIISIGDSKKHLLGKQKFHIEYDINGAVNYLTGKPQLYMSITGDHGLFRIDSATVDLHLPRGIKGSDVQAFTLLGSTGKLKKFAAPVSDGTIKTSVRGIGAGQGMTLSVSMPPGSVVLPSVLQSFIWQLQVSYQAIALPFGTMLVLTLFWALFGRDQSTGTAAPEGFRPPEYLTAAEAGTLIDERCDLIDVVSTVIDLAVRGFISIRVLPYNGFLYLSNRDYEFRLLKSAKDRELKPHEQVFLAAMFGLSDTTYLSAVRGNFAEYLPILRSRIYEELVAEGYFARDPENDRKQFGAVGAAVMVAGIGLLAASEFHVTGRATAVGVILSGLVIAFAAGAMPKRKSMGTRAVEQFRAFQRFIASGSRSEQSEFAANNPELFSTYLPYAMVLGMADRWAAIYQKQLKEFPAWFQVDRAFRPASFSVGHFVSNLGEAVQVINKALTEQEHAVTTRGYDSLR